MRRDPAQRPTAKQALAHPWLRGKSDERGQGAPLPRTVVQRLQRFGVENALKRTVLDMIANDLINQHMTVSQMIRGVPCGPLSCPAPLQRLALGGRGVSPAVLCVPGTGRCATQRLAVSRSKRRDVMWVSAARIVGHQSMNGVPEVLCALTSAPTVG